MSDGPGPPRRFHLLDLAAVVAGYAMASVLARAFWPPGGTDHAPAFAAFALAYLWLGLAMSGPLALAVRRRADASCYTRAELAWLMIGAYWIVLTVLVLPVRLRGARLLDSALLGVLPVVAALALRLLRPGPLADPHVGPSWTHRAAVVVLVTWPFAWGAMIALGKSL